MPKQNGDKGKAPSAFGIGDSFTLGGSKAAGGQQRYYLKPCDFFCKAGKAKENGEDFYNKDVDNTEYYQQNNRVDHTITSYVSMFLWFSILWLK